MTLGDKEFGQARCRINWQVGEVEKNVLSAGKVTDTGLYRIILDSEGSFLIHKPSGNQVKFKEKSYTFTLKASDIRAVATIAPVDAEMVPNPFLAGAGQELSTILEEAPAVDAS